MWTLKYQVVAVREILKMTQLFGELNDSLIDEIAATTSWKKARKGEMIINQGEIAAAFFIVASGKVKVIMFSPEGKEQILTIVEPGQTFAEAALFSGEQYPASAQTLEDSELVVVHRDRFVALLGRNPDLAINLIARLSQLLRKLTSLVEGLSLTDVTTRLARYLHNLSRETGKDSVVLGVRKSTLASELGTIPETLSRSFAKLVKNDTIKVDGSKIEILNPAGLANYSDHS